MGERPLSEDSQISKWPKQLENSPNRDVFGFINEKERKNGNFSNIPEKNGNIIMKMNSNDKICSEIKQNETNGIENSPFSQTKEIFEQNKGVKTNFPTRNDSLSEEENVQNKEITKKRRKIKNLRKIFRIRLVNMNPGYSMKQKNKEISRKIINETEIPSSSGKKAFRKKCNVKLVKITNKNADLDHSPKQLKLTRQQEQNLNINPIKRQRNWEKSRKSLKKITNTDPTVTKPDTNTNSLIIPKFVEIPAVNPFTEQDSQYIWQKIDFAVLFDWVTNICWGKWDQIAKNMGAIVSTGSIRESSYFLLDALIKASPTESHPILLAALSGFKSEWPENYRNGMSKSVNEFIHTLKADTIKEKLSGIEGLMAVSAIVAASETIPSGINVEIFSKADSGELPTKSWNSNDDKMLLTMIWMRGNQNMDSGVESAYTWTDGIVPKHENAIKRSNELIHAILDNFRSIKYPETIIHHNEYPNRIFPDLPNDFYISSDEQLSIANILRSYGTIDPEIAVKLEKFETKPHEIYQDLIGRVWNAVKEKKISEMHKCLPVFSIKYIEQLLKLSQPLIKAKELLESNKTIVSEDKTLMECILNYGIEKSSASILIKQMIAPLNADENNTRKVLSKALKESLKLPGKEPTVDSAYKPKLPMVLSDEQRIQSLGNFVNSPAFWNKDYIYPVDFCSELTLKSSFASCPSGTDTYICTIINQGERPIFSVSALYNKKISFEGSTPDEVWEKAIPIINEIDPNTFIQTVKTPGHELFGLMSPIVQRCIQTMVDNPLPDGYQPRFFKQKISSLKSGGFIVKSNDTKKKSMRSSAKKETPKIEKPIPQPVKEPEPQKQLEIRIGELMHRSQLQGAIFMNATPFLDISESHDTNTPVIERLKSIFDKINPSLLEIYEK